MVANCGHHPSWVFIVALIGIPLHFPFSSHPVDLWRGIAIEDDGPTKFTTEANSRLSRPSILSASAFPPHLYDSGREPYASFPCQPTGLHLSQANNVDEQGFLNVTLSFFLNFENCQSAKPVVVLRWGLDNEKRIPVVDPPLQFRYISDSSAGTFQSDWIYHVVLPHLHAGLERYWYRVVVAEEEVNDDELENPSHRQSKRRGETNLYSFLTPPKLGAPVALALVGDLGQTENSTKTMAHILKATVPTAFNPHPITQLMIAGDMSYADADPYRWTSWFEVMQPLLRQTLLHTAVGNHEIECNTETLDIFVPYENYFRNPNRIRDADMQPITDQYRRTLWNGECRDPSSFQGHYFYGNSFYSYTHGLARVIVLNSYTDAQVDTVQYRWFVHELEQANAERKLTPWLVVVFHAPFYTTFRGHVNETYTMQMRAVIEPLLVQYKVNLVVSGHDHAYMRTYPMSTDGTRDASGLGPIYLTLGAGGNREQHSSGFINTKQEDWVVKRDLSDYGYGHLWLPNSTHARFNWVRDGTTNFGIRDHVWFQNPHVSEWAERQE